MTEAGGVLERFQAEYRDQLAGARVELQDGCLVVTTGPHAEVPDVPLDYGGRPVHVRREGRQ